MKKYRIEEFLVNLTNIDLGARIIFRDLGLSPLLISPSVTREEYDSSDFTAWTLFYGQNKTKEMKKDTLLLLAIEIGKKPIFNVSGNGFGTGLLITSNLASKYD